MTMELDKALGKLTDREILILLAKDVSEIKTVVKSQNGRIGKLEALRNKVAGATVLLTVAFAIYKAVA